jgi:hypothetical protein
MVLKPSGGFFLKKKKKTTKLCNEICHIYILLATETIGRKVHFSLLGWATLILHHQCRCKILAIVASQMKDYAEHLMFQRKQK